jgi:hypothetical protein
MRALVAAAVLLAAACASPASTSATPRTVVGRVLSAPSCPAQRVGVACAPRPVDGARVVALQNGDVAAATHTDGNGGFSLQLRPGQYVIRATNVGALATTAQRRVTVDPDGPDLVIRLVVDSGIR